MRSFLLILSVLLSVHFSVAQHSPAQQVSGAGGIVIKLKPGYTYTDLLNDTDISKLYKADLLSIEPVFPNAKSPSREKNQHGQQLIDLTRYFRCSTGTSKHIDFIRQTFKKSPITAYAENLQLQELLYVPDDPLNESNQYYLDIIDAYSAFDVQTGDTNMIIGITDTGIDLGHEDLVYNIAYNRDDPLDGIDNDNDGYVDNFRGWDLGDNDNNPQTDYSNHGTWVSGLAAADTDNGKGITGPGFDCRILPVKISDSDSLITRGYEGIVYAANSGASIINCSWGNHQYSEFEQDMVNYAAINKNALVVAACGNDDNMDNFYPASYDNVLSVAATTSDDEKWDGSSYGYHVDMSAPGTNMHTIKDGGGYRNVSAGTSFASPVVSGIAGLVRSHYPGMSANQVLERLKNTTDVIDTIPYNIDYAGLMGTGRLNAYHALTDGFQPGVNFRNIEIIDDREDNYENSLLVEIKGEFFNYLSPAQDLQVDISTNSTNINLLTTSIDIGALDSLQAFPVLDNPIQLEILSGISADEHIVLSLEMSDGDWERTQYIEFDVMPSWKTLTNADMQLSIPGNGRLGFSDLYRKNGRGYNYSNIRDLFYDGGLITGKSSGVIFDGIRNINKFTYDDLPEYINYPDSKESIKSVFFAEDVENAVNLEIIQTSIAPENNDNLYILKYDFINHNLSSLDNWYAGLFFDWDLIKPTRNRTMYDSLKNFGYTYHTGEQVFHSAVKLLSPQEENQYALDQRSTSGDLVILNDGFSDEEKFYTLSNTNYSAGMENNGSDVAQVFSAGNFSIPPVDTVTVCFAVMAGNGMLEINRAVDSADMFYQQHIQESNVPQSSFSGLQVFPNPATDNFILQLPDNISEGKITIYSIAGQALLTKSLFGNKTKIDVNLPSGNYVLHVDTGDHLFREPLIILNAD
ncbi:MAG: S8 family peptidase [Bacteroidota bacterium]